MNRTYGQLPVDLGHFPIKVEETMSYLYMPIKMKDSAVLKVPNRLKVFYPLLARVFERLPYEQYFKNYFYITAKHQLVNPQAWGARGGWHADGFLTNDLNWIWSDSSPTIFNTSEFDITPDHNISLGEFSAQAKHENNVTYSDYTLLELNPYVVHEVAPVTRYFMRTFVKISMSPEKYNLKGNTHNYDFDYSWKMYDRDEVRNHPVYAELSNSDYVPADVA